jgi:hypothetical protein
LTVVLTWLNLKFIGFEEYYEFIIRWVGFIGFLALKKIGINLGA